MKKLVKTTVYVEIEAPDEETAGKEAKNVQDHILATRYMSGVKSVDIEETREIDESHVVTLYKGYNPGLGEGWFWGMEKVCDEQNGIFTEPYLVEIPEGFCIRKNIIGAPMFFKGDEKVGYELVISSKGFPSLIGGGSLEMIRLHVIRKGTE